MIVVHTRVYDRHHDVGYHREVALDLLDTANPPEHQWHPGASFGHTRDQMLMRKISELERLIGCGLFRGLNIQCRLFDSQFAQNSRLCVEHRWILFSSAMASSMTMSWFQSAVCKASNQGKDVIWTWFPAHSAADSGTPVSGS